VTASSGSSDALDVSPVEAFLDAVLIASAAAPARETRRLLAETEAHLRDATNEAVERGLTREEAERDAVHRFGTAADLVRAEARRHAPSLRTSIRPCVGSVLLFAGLAGIAMGVSAVITAIMGAIGGSTFIVNISSRTHLAPSDCTRWLTQDPSARTCYQAALRDWTFETVTYRGALSILGVLAIVAFIILRRRWSRRNLATALPRSMTDAVAFTVFGAAGIWLVGLGIDAIAVNSGRAPDPRSVPHRRSSRSQRCSGSVSSTTSARPPSRTLPRADASRAHRSAERHQVSVSPTMSHRRRG